MSILFNDVSKVPTHMAKTYAQRYLYYNTATAKQQNIKTTVHEYKIS